MTIGATLAIVFLLIADACLCMAYINLDKAIDSIVETMTVKKDFDEMTFHSIQAMKKRIDEADEIARNARSRTRELEKKLERSAIYEEKR